MSSHDWRKLQVLLIALRGAKQGADYANKMIAVRKWIDDYVARQAQDFV